jgi:hypothetical protein
MGRNKHKSRNMSAELGERNLDKIIEASCSKYMYEFKLDAFKESHSRLYKAIRHAMLTYAISCINYADPPKIENNGETSKT